VLGPPQNSPSGCAAPLPSAPSGRVAQLARALPLQGRCRGFESLRAHQPRFALVRALPIRGGGAGGRPRPRPREHIGPAQRDPGLALFSGSAGVVLALLATMAVHGAANPVHQSLLQRAVTEPRHRATVLSANSLTGHLGWVIGALGLGVLAEAASLTIGILAGAALLAIAAPLYLVAGEPPSPARNAQRARCWRRRALRCLVLGEGADAGEIEIRNSGHRRPGSGLPPAIRR
jgi:hypothetical protein